MGRIKIPSKKVIAIILTLSFVFCSLPLTVFVGASANVAETGGIGYDSLQRAIDDAQPGATVTLLDNVELSEKVTVSGNIILDLAGKIISQTKEQTAPYSMIVNNGVLCIKDSVGGGKISYIDSGNGGEYVSNTILNNSTLIVESGKIENLSSATVASNGYPQTIDTNGALIVSGGEIYCENYSSVRIWCTTDDNTSVSISGGTFTGSVDLHNVNNSANKGTLSIVGGTFRPNNFTTKVLRLVNFGSDIDELNMTISGDPVVEGDIGLSGSVTSVDMTDVVEVTGGTFASDISPYVPAEYVCDSYVNGQGKTVYGIAKSGNIAVNTTTSIEYTDLQEAVNAAEAGQIVKLLGDIIVTAPIAVTKSMTLDGDGNTLTYTGSDRAIEVSNSVSDDYNVMVRNLTVVTPKAQRGINYNDNGILTLSNVTVKGDISNKAPTYAVNFPAKADGATVVIDGCDITGLIALNIWGEGMTVTVTDTKLTSMDSNSAENYVAIMLNNDGVNSAEDSIITVTGGSITALDQNGDPSIAVSNATTNGKVNISETTMVNGKVKVFVAIVRYENNTFYSFATLQDAIDKAIEDGMAVDLLRDVTEDDTITVDGAVTINGNGFSLTSSAGRAINIDTTEEVIINDLKIVGTTGCERGVNIINQASTTNLNNVTILGQSHYAVHVAISAGAAKVNIDECDLTGYGALAIYGDGTVANVTDSILVGINPYEDNGSNDFSTIAVGADSVDVNVFGGSVTAEATEGLAGQGIIGSMTGSSTNLTVTLDTELITKGTAVIIGLDPEEEHTLEVRAEYRDKLLAEGFAIESTATEGMITLDYSKSVYTVKFDANGGEGTMADMLFQYDEPQTLANNTFTREGYTFIGWNTKKDLTGSFFADKLSVGNLTDEDGGVVTLYAMWEINRYEVVFKADGQDVTARLVNHGEDLELPAVPKKDGYTGKWDHDGKNITADTVINAVYTKNDAVVVPDAPKPPETGDNSNIWLWTAFAFVSGVTFFGMLILKKKEETEA